MVVRCHLSPADPTLDHMYLGRKTRWSKISVSINLPQQQELGVVEAHRTSAEHRSCDRNLWLEASNPAATVVKFSETLCTKPYAIGTPTLHVKLIFSTTTYPIGVSNAPRAGRNLSSPWLQALAASQVDASIQTL